MDRIPTSQLRALPRAFVPGISNPAPARIVLPLEEADKFRKVLRLARGDEVALLPNDGRVLRCALDGTEVDVVETYFPETEASRRLTVAIALSKPDALEAAVRAATELGVAEFVFFASDRSVVRWGADQWPAKSVRLERIARESAEVAYRTRCPVLRFARSLDKVLEGSWYALSEREDAPRVWTRTSGDVTVVVGPEGGWSPAEVRVLQARSVSLGPRVLKVETAVAAVASLELLP